MKCDKIGELLSPYLDSMTNEKEIRCVEDHIASCTDCRQQLEQLRLVRNAMLNLDKPEVPDTFLKDFHERISNEKLKYFGQKQIKTPQRPGWIAASVAGLALAAGIFASSFLPFGQLVANLQERNEQNKKPSSVAIDNILENVKNHLASQSDTVTPGETKPETVAAIDEPAAGKEAQPGTAAVSPGKSAPLPQQPAAAQVFTTSVKVADIGSSMQQVVEIAGDHGGQFTTLAEPVGVQAFSGARTKAVSIKVNQEDADEVLAALNNVGAAQAAESGKLDITKSYNEAQTNINDIQAQIKDLEAKEEKNDADKAKIEELKRQLFQWNQKKEGLNRTTIIVNLMEEGTP